jgi:hypothetical protein
VPQLVPIRDDPNEPYIIMEFDPDNPKHVQVFADMDRQSEALKWMAGHQISTPEELDELIRSSLNDSKDPRLLLAVATRDKEIVGWVQYYPEHTERIESIKKQTEVPENALIWETSFLKYLTEVPHPGVAVNGIKQTLQIIMDLERTIAQATNKTPRPVVITAYTDPANGASEAVLRKNGFQLLAEEIDYDGELNNTWVKII